MVAAPVRLSLKDDHGFPCDILIEEGIFRRSGSNLNSLLSKTPSSIAIITDSHLGRYAKTLRHDLSKYTKVNIITFQAGEKSKTLETASTLLAKIASVGLDRKGAIICLGGGVVGDLGGFVASIYKRGIAYFQFPTSLLAQVDSSIGGKTGVDSEWGKNQIGTFNQPRGVLIDPDLLGTLPRSELINGIGEIIKYSIIADKKLFDTIRNSEMSSSRELKHFVPGCCRIKVAVVSKDPREENMRSILNYGHTVGHALEAASSYSLSHGRSVILGMMAEAWIARELGFGQDFDAQEELLSKFKPQIKSVFPETKKLMSYALADKKSSSGEIRMSLPEKIGKMHTEGGSYMIPVSRDLFVRSIDYLEHFLSPS